MTEKTFQTKRPTNPQAEELLGKYFPVFDDDASFVALWDYMGTDECIEKAARVSYAGGGTRKVSQTRGLIRYLKRHFHSTPTEMMEVKFHCSMPIFVARQTIRHRTFSVNEVSGRYSLLPMLFYTPKSEQFKTQSKDNKQGRGNVLEEAKYKAAVERWNQNRIENQKLYEDLTGGDLARELARIDLPLSTYTQWIWKVDLHNLQHFLSLRCDSHAQWEVRQFANVIAAMFKRIAPISYEAWIDYHFCARRFTKMELEILSELLYAEEKHDSLIITPKSENGIVVGNIDLPKRERSEFFQKLQKPELVDFELDLEKAKTAEYFEKLFELATPRIDKGQK